MHHTYTYCGYMVVHLSLYMDNYMLYVLIMSQVMLGNLKKQRSVCPSDQEIDLEVMKGNKE